MIIETPEWLSNQKELSTVDINYREFRTAASTVYEPAEDTFLVLDALQQDLESIIHNRLICQNKIVESSSISGGPLLVVELGSGSGIISAAVAKALRDDDVSASVGAHYIAVDMNPAACQATAQTCTLNGVQVDIVCGDLLSWMRHTNYTNANDNHLQDLYGPIDILLFNPPYVRGPNGESAFTPLALTHDSEDLITENQLLSKMVDAAWLGGGPDGVDIIKRALHQAADLLSERGVFYLLMIDYNYAALVRDEMHARLEQAANNCSFNQENSTDYIILTNYGSSNRPLACRRVLSRHVPGERLAVYRIYRPHISDCVIDQQLL